MYVQYISISKEISLYRRFATFSCLIQLYRFICHFNMSVLCRSQAQKKKTGCKMLRKKCTAVSLVSDLEFNVNDFVGIWDQEMWE